MPDDPDLDFAISQLVASQQASVERIEKANLDDPEAIETALADAGDLRKRLRAAIHDAALTERGSDEREFALVNALSFSMELTGYLTIAIKALPAQLKQHGDVVVEKVVKIATDEVSEAYGNALPEVFRKVTAHYRTGLFVSLAVNGSLIGWMLGRPGWFLSWCH
jgi:hypothetical protein